MKELIALRIFRMVFCWSIFHVLGGALLVEYHVKHPSWQASLYAVLVLEAIGEILRGRLTKPDA